MVGPRIFVAGKTCGNNAFVSKAQGKPPTLSYLHAIDGAKKVSTVFKAGTLCSPMAMMHVVSPALPATRSAADRDH
jgi:hypothetical protein